MFSFSNFFSSIPSSPSPSPTPIAGMSTIFTQQQQQSLSFNKDKIEKQIKKWNNKIIKFKCPLSHQIMIDPVSIENGKTFDRFYIEEWFKLNNTCPITKLNLKSKILTSNSKIKLIMKEEIVKYLEKIIKNVKLWLMNDNLIEICFKLINDTINLIYCNSINYKEYLNQLYELKLNILLNEYNLNDFNNDFNIKLGNNEEEELFNKYMLTIKEITDLDFKILQLKRLEDKLFNENYLENYYKELLNLLIESKISDNKQFKEIFLKYYELNKIDNDLITKIFNYLQKDEYKFEYLNILYNVKNYNKCNLLEHLVTIKVDNKEEMISLFKSLFKEINLNEFNLIKLVDFIKDYNELFEEKMIVYNNLYKQTNEIKYLELIYEFNKEIENDLLNEYLKLNMLNKYFNLYYKINENKIDPFNNIIFKVLQYQNNKIENIINNNLQSNNFNLQIEDRNKEITKIKQSIEDLNNFKNILQNELNLNELQNQQKIINNFKINHLNFDYCNIIKITVDRLNITKEKIFYSDPFEAIGLQWRLKLIPKGSIKKSKEDECAIFLHLNSLQYSNKNDNSTAVLINKEISSVNIQFIFDNMNLLCGRIFECNYVKLEGRGSWDFKRDYFIPKIENDKEIYSFVIGIKKLNMKFKN
ncbi:hypothetical protein ABK040_000532 [Willaertia magna]